MNTTNEYKYLWDGSEPGWALAYIYRQCIKISLNFGGTGPSLKEIKSLRAIIPEYGELPATEVLTKLRTHTSLDLGEFEPVEGRRISDAFRKQGLTVEAFTEDRSGYLPINELTNVALIIEDDEISRQVCAEALRLGLPVRHIEA
ncbi:hypothetical protein [Paucibacter sp. XJ19-41]|uniref:hypothetical protein n=1 Tax=Paucibacter sp. XJ19-41 TaxID=2927824 RepID=UPI00234A367D|nr:hypothetical protein [Paucibacter sp. XJ19-41]MDC6171019.1 hypothetical protein [Paucibacter sp. XJ19-41]